MKKVNTTKHIFILQENAGEDTNRICGSEGTCVNLEGSFDCECPPGFVFAGENELNTNTASNRSNKGCIDIDECSLYFNPCGQGKGICYNKVYISIY